MTNGIRMPQNELQMQATDAVANEMASRNWKNTDLSEATRASGKSPVDLGTIGDFLSYKRWPKLSTLGRIEKALGWEPGTIRLISIGKAPHPTKEEPGMPSPGVLREIASGEGMLYKDVLEAALYEYGYLPETPVQWSKTAGLGEHAGGTVTQMPRPDKRSDPAPSLEHLKGQPSAANPKRKDPGTGEENA